MPSAEMSSSEILRGSQPVPAGSYNPGSPPDIILPETVSLVDDGMWKRYSSHYEFPLSLLLSLGIHILAFLIVLAVMSISYYFGKPPPPVMETVLMGEGSQPTGPVGGSRPKGDDSQFTIEKFTDVVPPEPEHLPRADILPDQREFRKELDRKQLGRRDGIANRGKGDGQGEGDHLGDGKRGAPYGRSARWRINLKYDEPETFISQLSNLQVMVAARVNSGRFYLFKELPASGSFNYDEMTAQDAGAFFHATGRLGFHTQDANTADNFRFGVNLSERVLDLWIYIPKSMEAALLDRELKHYGLTEDKVRERRLLTNFEVRRDADRWHVTITKSEVGKPAKLGN